MPYVDCLRCGRNVFTAAYWSSVEYCPHCDAELPRSPSAGFAAARARSRRRAGLEEAGSDRGEGVRHESR